MTNTTLLIIFNTTMSIATFILGTILKNIYENIKITEK